MPDKPHLTTRRGFIAAMGFGGVGLYGLWAAYGAAPGPLAILGLGGGHDDHGGQVAGGGHDGHGAASSGPTIDEFRHLVAEFVERHRLPDGSVHPRPLGGVMPMMDHSDHAMPMMDHSDHAMPMMDHSDHAMPMMMDMDHGGQDDHGEHGGEPLAVYMLAERWFYEPAHLRLDAGTPYRFRMMATDVSHGASIQFGQGARMIRLRPGRMSEIDMTFARPGRYLVYCTVYCGSAHDHMQALIEVI